MISFIFLVAQHLSASTENTEDDGKKINTTTRKSQNHHVDSTVNPSSKVEKNISSTYLKKTKKELFQESVDFSDEEPPSCQEQNISDHKSASLDDSPQSMDTSALTSTSNDGSNKSQEKLFVIGYGLIFSAFLAICLVSSISEWDVAGMIAFSVSVSILIVSIFKICLYG